MNSVFKSICFGVSALFLLVGCISVSYKGESFPPTEKVQILKGLKKVPEGYKVMGKVIAHAPSEDFSNGEIINKIVSRAEAEGADAVLIQSLEEIKTDEVREDEFLNTTSNPDAGWGVDDNFDGDVEKVDDDFNDTRNNKRIETPIFKTVIKALFLKKTTDKQ